MASSISPAEQLKLRHAANPSSDHAHNPTIEEIPDEDDIQHPPPTSHVDPSPAETTTLSDVARGKKPAAAAYTRPAASFNVNSEEAFPSLGAGKAPPATAQTWSRKPDFGANGNGNGNIPTNGGAPTPQYQRTPVAPVPAKNLASIGSVNLPGRTSEQVTFAPNQIAARKDLKKPIQEVLRDINRKSKAKVVAREGNNGGLIFEGTGPRDAVRQALKDVAREIGSKQSIKVPVPASLRAFVIGKQGATIQGITKRSGARVQVPRQDEHLDLDDEDAHIDVLVEGDAVSAELARREIQKIIDDRSSSSSMSLKDVPPEFYSFLAGPRQSNIANLIGGQDLNIQIPTYHTWQGAPPAQPASQGHPAAFLAQPSLPIRISGDRQAAQQARERIDQQVNALRRQLTSHQVPIERGRHQFIVGHDGESLQDIIAETGCSVILPPNNDDSEELYIIGPPGKIDNAVNKILDIAASMAVSNVDVARQHAKAPPTHAHNVSRYLQERHAIADLERQYAANFVLPSSRTAPQSWQIFSADGKQGMRARTDAMNLIGAHPPSRFHTMKVNPFYHSHLQKQAPQARREHGVHLLFPIGEPESHEVIVVYEQPGSPSEYQFPRQAPTPQQIQEHQKAVQAAVKFLNDILGPQAEIVSQHVEAPPKYHDKVQRFVERQNRELPPTSIPAQILLGRHAQKAATPGFQLRGPANDVEQLNAQILAFLEQEKKDELERGFTMSFEYPHKFASHLIGRKGDNIKKLQDDFDVEINYTENKVDLKGPKAKCEACKSHIISSAKKLEDEATHVIKIPQQHHYELKGPKGSQVMRLQERYNVRINFPRQAAAPADDADAATEVSFKNQPTQAPDTVIIKGPRKGADDARDELLNLLQYVVDNSNTATVSVAAKQIPSLIGAGGRELDTLRTETKCRIDMPKKEDVDGNDRVEIRLRGTKKQVEEAKKLLLEKAKSFDNTVTESLEIDQKFYKTIIGPSGATLSKIVADAGGPEDRRLANRYVTFPKQGSSDTAIKLQGSKPVVDKIKKAILALVSEKEGQTTETIEIAQELHRHLIGPGGSIRRKMEEDFNVEINVPRTETSGPERSQVKISGKPEDVAKAKVHISSVVKSQASETIDIPLRFHHIISEDGNIFRRLRNEHGISIDHAGKRPPQKDAEASASRGRVNADGGALPLITDDAAAASHSWEVVEPQFASTEEGNIPWVLRGNADNMAKAIAIIEQKLANASKPLTTGYLILPDPRLNRFVIGPNGSTINSIRQQTGVQIQVPKQGSGSEAIEIKGPKDGVEKAKDLVLEAIEQGAANGGGPRRR